MTTLEERNMNAIATQKSYGVASSVKSKLILQCPDCKKLHDRTYSPRLHKQVCDRCWRGRVVAYYAIKDSQVSANHPAHATHCSLDTE
jgi:hypothetical protein